MTGRTALVTVLTGLSMFAAVAGCTDEDAGSVPVTSTPDTSTSATSTATPDQLRAGSVQAAREIASGLAGLRFTIDGAGGYAQCSDDGGFVLYDLTIRLRQTSTTAAPPRTPAITAALADRGWTVDPTRGNSSGTNTDTVMTRGGSGIRIREYGQDPTLILIELTSDCVEVGDRSSTYIARGDELFDLK